MTAKHPVSSRYLVPALVIAGLVNAFLVLLYSSSLFGGSLRALLASCGVALFIASLWTSMPRVKLWAANARHYQSDVEDLTKRREKLGDCTVIGYYSTDAGHYPLAFASEYTPGVNGNVLKALYSDLVSYHGYFMSFSQESRLAEVQSLLNSGRCVLMQGWPLSGNPPNLPPGYTLHEVASGAGEAVYRLVPAALP
jgi:hypothetical protein